MEKQEYEKSILDYEGVQDAVACAREDGEKDGFERGKEEGIAKVVKTMFANGLDIDTISKVTGLEKEMVEKILE